MSTSDFVTEAEENLRLALAGPGGYRHLSVPELVGLAQVNGTLALAGEQRFANMIAFLPYTQGDTHNELRERIEDALGLHLIDAEIVEEE